MAEGIWTLSEMIAYVERHGVKKGSEEASYLQEKHQWQTDILQAKDCLGQTIKSCVKTEP